MPSMNILEDTEAQVQCKFVHVHAMQAYGLVVV